MEDPDDDKMVTRWTMFKWMSLNPYVSLLTIVTRPPCFAVKKSWGRHLILDDQLPLLQCRRM